MPRLTKATYYDRHDFLAWAWKDLPGLFMVLPSQQQWDVHAYYIPSKTVSRGQLLAHRQTITDKQPSLPQRASKAFGRMQRIYDWANTEADGDSVKRHQLIASQAVTARSTGRRRTLRISGLAKPEPNVELFTKVLIDIARQMQAEDQAKKQDKDCESA